MRVALVVALLALAPGCRQVFGLEDPVAGTGDAMTLDDGEIASDAPSDAHGTDGGDVDSGVKSASLEFRGFTSDASDVSTFTFTGVDIGTPMADRRLLVVAHGRSTAPAFASATLSVDGVVATKVVAVNEGTTGATTALFILPKAQGTTATIVLSYLDGGGARRGAVGVWAAYGLTTDTPHDIETFTLDATDPSTVMLDVPSQGIYVAGVSMSSVPLGTTSVWSGVTQNYNQLVEASLFSGSSGELVTGATVTVTHDSTDTTTSQRLIAASFR